MLKTLTPNLMAEDVRATAEWYESVLGFHTDVTVPEEGTLDFAILSRDHTRLMLSSRSSFVEGFPEAKDWPVAASQTFYIEVDGIDELRRAVEGKVRILKDMHETFYGTREFYFTDCNGYILSFSEDIASGGKQ